MVQNLIKVFNITNNLVNIIVKFQMFINLTKMIMNSNFNQISLS